MKIPRSRLMASALGAMAALMLCACAVTGVGVVVTTSGLVNRVIVAFNDQVGEGELFGLTDRGLVAEGMWADLFNTALAEYLLPRQS